MRLERTGERVADDLPVARVYASERSLEARFRLPALEAVDAVQLVGPRDAARLDVPFPAPKARELLRFLELLLSVEECLN